MKSLLFLGSNEFYIEFMNVVNNNPKLFSDIRIVFNLNYEDALVKLSSRKFEIALIELEYADNKGVDILSYIKKNKINIKIYAITDDVDNNVLVFLKNIGVDNIVRRPINYRFLALSFKTLSILDTDLEIKEDEYLIEEFTLKILSDLGVPTNLCGYYYLKIAVQMCSNNQKLVKSITTELYPLIAQKESTAPSRVERGIRHAIGQTNKHGNLEKLNELLGYMKKDSSKKPTNSQFISAMVENVLHNISLVKANRPISYIDNLESNTNEFLLAENFNINYLGKKKDKKEEKKKNKKEDVDDDEE